MFKFISFLLLVIVVVAPPVNAQLDSLGVAIPTEVVSENVEAGHIICLKEGGFVLCEVEYDPSMYGVVAAEPALSFRHDDDESLHLVFQRGNTLIKITSENGDIIVGDLVTSSSTPGVAQKATLNGYALGMALEDYSNSDTTAIGEVFIALNIHPIASAVTSRSNIIGSLRQALSAPVISPLATFRYLLAFLIVLISFSFGFLYFGRVIKSGVDAIGRNPLAKDIIQRTVLLNIVITLVIVFTGLAVALLILII